MQNNPQDKKQLFWNRKMIEKFIQLYKENVCLYDVSHENYNNQTVKTHALKNIAQNMQQYLPNLQLDDVEDKIKAIRSQLSEEISFIEAAETSGDKYVPNLWCFDQLEFLRKHLTSLTNSDSKKDISFYEETHNVVDDAQSEDSDISLYTEMLKSNSKPTIKIKWNRDDIRTFILLFKKYNILYDRKNKDYSNHKLRNVAYYKLLKETKKINPLIELKDIRAKIHTLRSQYIKEVHCLKKAKQDNETYTPSLWCFKMLANLYNDDAKIKSYFNIFMDESSNDELSISHLLEAKDNKNDSFKNELLEFEEIQVADENVIEYEEESEISVNVNKTQNNEILPNTIDYESVNTFEYDSHDSPPAKKICFNEENCDNDEMTEDSTKVERRKKSINNSEDTKYDWLGDLVVSQMREISQRYRTEFAWDVQCLLRKYILKSKSNQEETQSSNSLKTATDTSSQGKTSVPQEIVLPRSSNVSFNISFV